MKPATILVVDNTADILALTSSVLEEAGYAVLRCNGSQEALALLAIGTLVLMNVFKPKEEAR